MTLLHVTTSWRIGRLSLAALLLGVLGNPLFAQCVPANGDSSFAQDNGTNTPQFPGDRQFFFRIARVVGPGVASEYVSQGDPDPTRRGTLVNWDALQQNGVVSKSAYLQFSGRIQLGAAFWGYMALSGNLNGDPAAAAVKFQYSINGVPLPGIYVASATISNPNVSVTSVPFVRCVAVDTKYLRFGKKLDLVEGGLCSSSRAGDSTCPGVNEVDVRIVSTWWGNASALAATAASPAGLFSLPFLALAVQPSAIRDSINVIAAVGTLSFKALHPVIMIHGNSSSELFWTGSAKPNCALCDPHWFFEQPFIAQRIPYFRRINMDNALAEDHVAELQMRIRRCQDSIWMQIRPSRSSQ